jgi:hypothetical protein
MEGFHEEINTHGVIIGFGKHKGTLLTRVPLSYLKWLINEVGMDPKWRDLARAEFERRGDTMPLVEISGHAIDKASLRVLNLWESTRNRKEGLYSWLQRITLRALKEGKPVKANSSKIRFWGMKLVIEQGEEFPVLKTIM